MDKTVKIINIRKVKRKSDDTGKRIKLLNREILNALTKNYQYILLWDEAMPLPGKDTLLKITRSPGDVWHTGLLQGMRDRPFLLNFINPTWMFNRDPDGIQRITSFRMHLVGSLFKKEVFRHIGVFDENFETLEGAALDMGLRLIKGGAFIIFEPALMEHLNLLPELSENKLSLSDEVKILQKHYSKEQIIWALFRSIFYGCPLKEVLKNLKYTLKVRHTPIPIWERTIPSKIPLEEEHRVSIIIPTLRRHKYIKNVLNALRIQTVKPTEIIVIDEDQFTQFYSQFVDLPLIVLTGSNKGQSTARNIGLKKARGNYIMILDDDIDEIPRDFIETHLKYLQHFKTDASCGTVRERGVDMNVHKFKKTVRASDVFPTNNVLFKAECLNKSGLFDTNFDKGMRADHDLGMRIYLSGYLLGINPFVEVFHHRAPRGGLRENRARTTTFSDSRTSLFKFSILHKTEIYLMLKYYKPHQVKEELLLNIRGFFIVKGNILKRILKIAIATFLFPVLTYKLLKNYKEAKKLFK